MTHDWAAFLGPSHNATSTETKLSRMLPPPLVWEFPKGSGYASPAILGERLVFLHRLGNEEIVECLHPETGSSQWQFRYPTAFEDRYGYNNGPRSSPVIDEGRVYTVGAEGKIHCLDLGSGKVVWKRDLRAEYRVPQDFFGTASTPLVEGRLLIVNVGAPGGPCVAGLDKATGREAWRAGKEWGPSYASPVPAVMHGKRRVFVFAGGESSPPTGGLMSIDPADGRVDFVVPWRSRTRESVNASCPVVFDNKVFMSASYRTGSALVEVRPDFTHRVVWTTQEFGLHFNTAIYRDGYLYGFDGRNEPDASLACVDAASGKVVWRETPEWTETLELRGSQAAAAPGNVPRIAAGRGRPVPVAGGAGTPALDGPDAEGLPGGVAGMAVRGARIVGASGPQPRPAVCRAELARYARAGRTTAAVLRPAGVARFARRTRGSNVRRKPVLACRTSDTVTLGCCAGGTSALPG